MLRLQANKLLWKDLMISPHELRLNSLRCGQSFRWKQIQDHWVSVLHGRLVVLKETPSTIMYGYQQELKDDAIQDIKDYFQLDRVSLQACYERWSALDANFAKKAAQFQGIRMLRQDPWENLISFICSSNNNITRISLMIDKLCTRFGKQIGEYEQQMFYEFPTLHELTLDPQLETTLRQLGFGYRAKYIANTAHKLKQDHPDLEEQWLYTLRQVPYEEAKAVLMEFQGVGPKVADCVCLMSLDHSESIPVDTHVWQIALRDYGFKNKAKTLNQKLYVEVGNHFRVLFGDYSGWAHSVLFTADLKNLEKTLKREILLKEEIKVEVKRIKKEDYIV
ncbi:DNA glycosylase [Gilbertella persicaria]|uniref:DNA glycosylase n=1 Tax=Gilbertella persicaria TaxID=101096 RepID=UPI00221E8AB6|nr:DNA glycosylase [Gilbertella persicaria]KAI8056287.1 DNA glycosylase [Gilbertella persicaria]